MSQDNSKRQTLRVITKLMAAFGLLAFVALLLSSMSGPPEEPLAKPSMLIETGHLAEGQVEYTLWHGRPILIYKRRQEDHRALQVARQSLSDAQSLESRSLTPEWFVAFSSGTDQGCPIELRLAGGDFQGQPWLGGFADTCRGSLYDFAGRVFAGQAAAKNLAIPPYTIKPDGAILLGGR